MSSTVGAGLGADVGRGATERAAYAEAPQTVGAANPLLTTMRLPLPSPAQRERSFNGASFHSDPSARTAPHL